MLEAGLYEQVINKQLKKALAPIEAARKEEADIDQAEASKILAQYLTDVVQQGFDSVAETGNLSAQVNLLNKIVSVVQTTTAEECFEELGVETPPKQLLALLQEKDPSLAVGKSAKDVPRPETSIAQSSLFTGAVHEPQMFSELKKEIASADRIDMLVSFIKWSGLRLLIDELREFTQRGGELRIITTSYMGATDPKAIDELNQLSNTKIKVSYDTKRTRLHAKAYVFYRNSGFTTAYVGSSNLSNAAISSGLEWNVKVTQQDLPETMEKIAATFESYWNAREFEQYTDAQHLRLAQALKAEKYFDHNQASLYTMDITPYSYQQEILDRLDAERKVRGHYRNLLVAATGTGKTVISALDYKRFVMEQGRAGSRLLFVAHREEILKQSVATFRAVLKDGNFGELYVGSYTPDNIDALFISIQTFNSKQFVEHVAADYYDYIVVDEFHHATAKSYQKLLHHFKPKVLLGLTATPERMDGKSILPYFDHRIAAEIRLPEAIDRKLLCPFQYFGVTDTVDLDELKWTAGGYDKTALSDVYTFSGKVAEKRADWIVSSVLKYVTDIDEVKGLGFCVSIAHAEFMAEYFNAHGIPAMHLSGKSSEEERHGAKRKLVSGDIRFIFVVDIYNEGVDIPEINNILFLRPTESLTIFLQQLGRGLRLAENKDCLTVLDFIGQANKKYRFEEKFAALLATTERSVQREIEKGFVSVPKGCYIQLEKKAAQYILDNIRASYGRKSGLVTRIANFEEESGQALTLGNFLDFYHLEPKKMYKFESFSRLCVLAGVRDDFDEKLEATMLKAFMRFSFVDSRRWISFILERLPRLEQLDGNRLSAIEQRMLQMFYVTIWGEGADAWTDAIVQSRFAELANSPVLLRELIELLEYQYECIDFIDAPVDVGFDCPLDLHCTYSMRQITSAFDYCNFGAMQGLGVKYFKDKNADIFFITLNKADKDYSPTTMYKDYSMNESLFHWQSQSRTSDTSKTGQRYIHHKELGSRVLLFVREFKKDFVSGQASPYTYLGKASYVQHTGSRPMNIVWKLDAPIPAKFLKKTNKLVVG